jgi:putative phage-type endonuclease
MLSHQPIEGPMPYTDEWWALRQYDPERDVPVIFGASDAAAICGMSEYATPAHVFLSQTQPREKKADSDAQWFGKAIEPAVISRYREVSRRLAVAPVPAFFHPVHRFLSATPDGLVVSDKYVTQISPQLSVLEAAEFPIDSKSTGFRAQHAWGEEGTDEVPMDVLFQAQQQMLVMGAEHQETVTLLLSSRSIRIYPIERNEDLCDAIVQAAHELAARIIANDPPEPNWTHPRAREINKALFGINEILRKEADEEFLAARSAYGQALHDEKEAVAAKEAAKGQMEWLMGDAAFLDLGNGKEMVRSIVKRKEYVVKACEYVSMRERKIPK